MRRFILSASSLTVGVAIAILVFVSLTLRLVVIRPILRLNALMTDIVEGEGDLTRRVEATKEDEISDVARRINQFIEQIHVIVSNIKGFASSNAKLSGSLSASTVQTQNGALTVKSNVDSMQELMADLNRQNSDSATSISEIFANITESLRPNI